MPRLIEGPTIEAAGSEPKKIHEYITICLLAFSPDIVHRDAQ